MSDCNIEASKPYIAIELAIIGANEIGVDGWHMIGALEHTETGTLIYITTNDPFPLQYRDVRSNCDHCRQKRFRNWTYILQSKDGITFKQVGSTCLKDFTHHSVNSIAMYGELLKDLKKVIDEGEVCHGKAWLSLEIFLSEIASLIIQYGWTPKSAAFEGRCPTIEQWVSCIINHTYIEVSDSNRAIAKAAIMWAKELTDSQCQSSDYLHNLRTIAKNIYVEPRHEGLAASIIAAYNRFQEIEDKKRYSTISTHIGVIGNRQTFELTLERKFSFNGQYGTTYKLIFKDTLGNKVVWSTSNGYSLEEGKTYSLIGTVKAHSEYNSVSQTEITRCKIQ
jgi:hypothetical protein